MTALHARFLARVPAGGRLLDAGCGSGRDSLQFMQPGFTVDAFDSASEMVRHARAITGLPVANHSFFHPLPPVFYDGIWSGASLMAVPRAQLPAVFANLAQSLKPRGIWYACFASKVVNLETGDR